MAFKKYSTTKLEVLTDNDSQAGWVKEAHDGEDLEVKASEILARLEEFTKMEEPNVS